MCRPKAENARTPEKLVLALVLAERATRLDPEGLEVAPLRPTVLVSGSCCCSLRVKKRKTLSVKSIKQGLLNRTRMVPSETKRFLNLEK